MRQVITKDPNKHRKDIDSPEKTWGQKDSKPLIKAINAPHFIQALSLAVWPRILSSLAQ